MTLKKLIPILGLIPIIAAAQTPSAWVIPPPYYEGKHYLEDQAIQSIERDNDSIIFLHASKNQVQTKSSDIWMTKCFKSSDRGISVTSCLIQNPSDKNVKILVNANGTFVLLAPTKTKIKEINYKIDNNQINTSNESYLINKKFQFNLFSNLLIGKKLTYSYKVNQSYKSNEIPLEGVAENYYFSRAFISKN